MPARAYQLRADQPHDRKVNIRFDPVQHAMIDAAVAARGGSKSEFIADAALAAVRADHAGPDRRGRSARRSGPAATAWFTAHDLTRIDTAADRHGRSRSGYIADATLAAAHAHHHKDHATDTEARVAEPTGTGPDTDNVLGVPERRVEAMTVDRDGTRALVEAIDGLSTQLRRVGVNLNQVARATNTTGVADHTHSVLDTVDQAAARVHAFLDTVDLGRIKKKGA